MKIKIALLLLGLIVLGATTLFWQLPPSTGLVKISEGAGVALASGGADPVVQVNLTGWGWCPDYAEVANIWLPLEGNITPRANETAVEDLLLTGTLEFQLANSTETFPLELRGTRVRALFFLKQIGDSKVAEFEGSWLDGDNPYIFCQGRLATPPPDRTAKLYFFVLRTRESPIPEKEPGGSTLDNMEYLINRVVRGLDYVADRIGVPVKEPLAGVLSKLTVLWRGVTEQTGKYFP